MKIRRFSIAYDCHVLGCSRANRLQQITTGNFLHLGSR